MTNFLSIFKKKPKPIRNPGFYNWDFQYVEGGFCNLNNLHKLKANPKKWFVFIWEGGFKFRIGWARPEITAHANQKGSASYQTKVDFNPLHFPGFVDFADHEKNCQHTFDFDPKYNGHCPQPMRCIKCGVLDLHGYKGEIL